METFSRFVSPANSKASGLHWPYSGWLKILFRFVFTIIAFDRFEGRQTGFSRCLLKASEADSLQFRVWKKTNNWVRF